MARKPKPQKIDVFENGQLQTVNAEISTATEYRRVRSFCCITYIHEEALIRFLKNEKWIQHWALCVHDMDLNVDGSAKQEHIHVILYTYNAHSSSAVRKNFERYSQQVYRYTDYDWQNTLVEDCLNMVSQYRYLIHADDPDKYQYSPTRRKCDSDFYWYNLECSSGMVSVVENKGMAIVEDILMGVSERDLIARYGNAYIWHRKHYLECARAIIREEQFVPSKSNTESIFDIILNQDTPLTQDAINNFYTVLNYIKADCLLSYNSTIEFYLKEKDGG